jgi:disulfide bond formation protein DsbB
MTPAQMSTFFALLTLVALGLALACVMVRSAIRTELASVALPVAFLVAATATAGSLYYSEVAHYTPCELCWYQRIAMYPLSLMLLIAAVRRDVGVSRYVVPQAVAGAAIAIYHYQLQLFPDQGSTCDSANPCTFQWVDEFGFVSIPFMSLAGFLAIIALVVTARSSGPAPSSSPTSSSPARSEVSDE